MCLTSPFHSHGHASVEYDTQGYRYLHISILAYPTSHPIVPKATNAQLHTPTYTYFHQFCFPSIFRGGFLVGAFNVRTSSHQGQDFHLQWQRYQLARSS